MKTIAQAVLALWMGASVCSQSTFTAQSFFTDLPLLSPSASSFEEASVLNFAYQTSWQGWSFIGGGICRNGSSLLGASQLAPLGSCVAFIEGGGSVKCQAVAGAAYARLKLRVAPAAAAGAAGPGRLQVRVNGALVGSLIPQSDAYQEYVTTPFAVTSPSLLVHIENPDPIASHMLLVDDVRVQGLSLWGDAGTWVIGGSPATAPPGPNDNVVIPQGVSVLAHGHMQAGLVEVHGQLAASGASDLVLEAKQIDIEGPGAELSAGSEGVPFLGSFTIELRGVGGFDKRLWVRNQGHLSLHGRDQTFDAGGGRRRTWTRLARDSSDPMLPKVLTLQQPCSWLPDDEIVITGTTAVTTDIPIQGEPGIQAEVRKVTSVSADGLTVTLESPPTFLHRGRRAQSMSSSLRTWVYEDSAEVGLLTHNIKIQGDSATSNVGAHVMVHKGQCCSSGVGGRVSLENVEFRRVGEASVVGRYPLHWHMCMADGFGQYARSCSVHGSHNRAVVIHGTDGVDVEGWSTYDTMGHTFFFEDGSEQHNVMANNLCVFARRPAANPTIPSDNQGVVAQNRSPSAFWITNPNNTIEGNVACDTVGTAYWFVTNPNVTGQSWQMVVSTPPGSPPHPFASIHPDTTPLGVFRNNCAHSCASGIDTHDKLDDSGNIVSHPWRPSSPAVLEGTTINDCWLGIYGGVTFHRDITHRDVKLVNCYQAMMLAGCETVEQSLIAIDTSGNAPAVGNVYVLYDGPGRLRNSYIHGYDDPAGAYSLFGHTDAALRHANHRFRELQFSGPNSNPWPKLNAWLGWQTELVTPQTTLRPNATPGFTGTIVAYEFFPGAGATILPNLAFYTMGGQYEVPWSSWLGMPTLPAPTLATWPGFYAEPVVSMARFAFVRLNYAGSSTHVDDTITVDRYLSGGAWPSVPHVQLVDARSMWTDTWPWRQYHLMANYGFPGLPNASYEMSWNNLPTSSERPIELIFDNKDPDWIYVGSDIRLTLRGIAAAVPGGAPLSVFSNGQPLAAVPPASLQSTTVTSYAISANGNDLLLKVVSTGQTDTIRIH